MGSAMQAKASSLLCVPLETAAILKFNTDVILKLLTGAFCDNNIQ